MVTKTQTLFLLLWCTCAHRTILCELLSICSHFWTISAFHTQSRFFHILLMGGNYNFYETCKGGGNQTVAPYIFISFLPFSLTSAKSGLVFYSFFCKQVNLISYDCHFPPGIDNEAPVVSQLVRNKNYISKASCPQAPRFSGDTQLPFY